MCLESPLLNGVLLLKVTFLKEKEGKKELCWWVAKLNIQNEEMNKLISPIKANLPYFAYVIVAKLHKHTTVE